MAMQSLSDRVEGMQVPTLQESQFNYCEDVEEKAECHALLASQPPPADRQVVASDSAESSSGSDAVMEDENSADLAADDVSGFPSLAAESELLPDPDGSKVTRRTPSEFLVELARRARAASPAIHVMQPTHAAGSGSEYLSAQSLSTIDWYRTQLVEAGYQVPRPGLLTNQLEKNDTRWWYDAICIAQAMQMVDQVRTTPTQLPHVDHFCFERCASGLP